MKIAAINPSDYWKYFDVTCETSNRAAIAARTTFIESIQHNRYRSGTTSMVPLDESYKMVYSGIVFKTWSTLLATFNELLAKMESNGMMESWRRFLSFSKTKTEEIGPQVLTMDHLKVGFLACCIPMALAIIAFIGEVARSRIVCFIGCRRSSKSSNFEQKVEAISKIEVFDSNSEELEEETEIEKCNQGHNSVTCRTSLEDSNEPQVETTFQIEEEVNEIDPC